MQKIFDRLIKYSVYALVFLAPLAFSPWTFEAFEFTKQYLIYFLVGLALAAWILKMVLVDRQIKLRQLILNWAVLGFLGAAVLSAVFSVDRSSSFFGFYGRFSDGLLNLLAMAGLYFLLINNITQERKAQSAKLELDFGTGFSIESLLKTYFTSIALVAVITFFSISGIFSKIGFLPEIMKARTFNPAAASLQGLLPLLITGAVLLLVFNVQKIAVKKRRKQKQKQGKSIFFSIRFLVLIAALVVLIVFSNLAREETLNQFDSWAVSVRGALANVKTALIGSGIGTFHYDFNRFKSIEFNQSRLWQIRFDRPGNYFAEILATMGLVGLLSYTVLIALFLYISFFILRSRSKFLISNFQFLNNFQFSIFIALVVLMVAQVFYYQNTVLGFSFWLFLGLSASAWPQKERIFRLPKFSCLPAAAVLAVGLIAVYALFTKIYTADIYYEQSRRAGLEKQIEKLTKASELSPRQAHYRVILSRAYLNGALEEAEKPLGQQDQTLISDYFGYAIAFSKGGRVVDLTNQQLVDVRGAIEISPNSVASWETLGNIYLNVGTAAEGAVEWAVKAFERAKELEPANPALYVKLGKAYVMQGEFEKARESFEHATDFKPDYIEALVQAALTYELEGNAEQAMKRMRALSRSFPLAAEVNFELGRLYFNQNMIKEAIERFEKVVALLPNHSNALYSLASAYEKSNNRAKAKEYFERVLELNPGNEGVMQKLEEL